MNKRLIAAIALLLVVLTAHAQLGNVAYKSATNSFKTFKADSTRTKKLVDAKTAIDLAIKDSALTATVDFWQLRGAIYQQIARELFKRRLQRELDSSYVPDLKDNPTYQAYRSFEEAIGLSAKESENLNKAQSGLREAMESLNAEGQYAYDAKKYKAAYELYNSVLEGEALLSRADTVMFGIPRQRNLDQVYLAAMAARKAEMDLEAVELLSELYESEYKQAIVYQSLYNLKTKKEEDEDEVDPSKLRAAYPYLLKGREFFPEDPTLLQLQLEHLEQTSQYEEMVDVLIPALELDPDNTQLLVTLGMAYDQLFQKAAQAEALEEADQRFIQARNSYLEVLEREPEHFEVLLGLGTLYADKSALSTRKMVELSGDFSEEGMKAYDQVKEEVYSLLQKALPYLQKAESLEPNDTETLIALRLVYARQDREDMVKEFQSRLQNIMNGGRNTAYFKE